MISLEEKKKPWKDVHVPTWKKIEEEQIIEDENRRPRIEVPLPPEIPPEYIPEREPEKKKDPNKSERGVWQTYF